MQEVANQMKQALAEVASKLASSEHPMDRAARIVSEYLNRREKLRFEEHVHGSFCQTARGSGNFCGCA